jgi:capsid assembly protease
MRHLHHLATRIFDTPLLIAPQKLEVILSVLAPRLGMEAPALAAAATSERAQRKPYEVTPEGIAIIPIEGTLVHKAYGLDAWSGMRSYVDIQKEIEDAATDPAIKGILLDVDSPGGEVAGAFDLADTIYRARGTKPICGVANNDAFSAAYLLASAVDEGRLYLSRTSGVGSIGVIVTHLDMSAADEKAGLKYTIIHAGARKADFHPHAPLSEDAHGVLAAEIERTYGMLVATVARNRGLAEAAIREMESGLFFGSDAVNVRLANRLGTRQDALADLRKAVKGSSTRAAMSAEIQGGEKTMENENAAQPAPAPAQPAVDVDAVRAEARRQGYAEAREVVELCTLAGMPGMAADLLAKQVGPAEARQKLLVARAAEEPPEIRSHIMPDTGTNAKASLKDNPVMRAVERLTGKGGVS